MANKVNSSNGTLVFGAGNEVTHSLSDIYGVGDTTSLKDAKKAQDALKKAVAESNAGGAVLAIGGANKADWARKSQLIGVGNTLTGTNRAVSEYNMINGYKNEVTNATHTSIIGSNNKAKNIKSTIVMGDHNTLGGRENVISLGNNNTVDANDAVAIGNGTTVKAESGVAIGVGSVADRVAGSEKGARGAFAPDTIPTEQESTWTSTKGAVSVGDTANNITRQITNLAAGSEDTDAVNVAQLKKVNKEALKHSTVTDGANITVTDEGLNAGDGKEYKVALNNNILLSGDNDAFVNISGDKGSVWASSSVAAGNVIMDGTTATVSGLGNTTTAYNGFANGEGKAATEEQLKEVATEAGKHTQVKAGTNVGIVPGETEDGTHVYTVNADGTTVSGDSNVVVTAGEKDVNNVTNYGVKLNKDLVDIETISNGDAKLTLGGFATELTNGQGASVKLFGDATIINGKVNVYNDGRIAGVADGVNANDAVNVSQLQKAAAASATTVSDGVNTTVTATKAKDGHTDYKVNLNKDLVGIESISNGDAKLTLGGFATELANGQGASVKLFGDTTTINNAVTVYKDGRIAGVADGINDNDAVNVGQLKEAVEAGNTDTHIKAGEYGVGTDNKVNMQLVDKNGKDAGTVTITDVAKASDVGDVNNIASDIKNKEGKTTVVDAVNNLNNKVGDLQYSKVEKGEIADGDSTTTAIGKLDQKLTDVAATAAKHTKVVNGSNITVEETAQDGQKTYKVGLNKDLLLGDISISGTNGTIETTGSIATKDKIYADKGAKLADIDITGDTISNGQSSVKLDKEGTVTINGKVSVNQNGKVSGVAAGDISATSTDAVNGGQLYETNQAIANNATNISSLSHSISNLDNRVNKVGAGAAALAALHPLDFDPDAKWDFAAGYGNYRGANAAAVGAYYRPNEDTMFSVGGTFGNGENMVNAGVSFKLGSGSSHVSTSRVAMAKEIKELRGELEAMKSAMLDANAGKKIDTSKLQLFPDVPQNHWAYEYVAQLAGNGMIEGYPDGNFAGDRPMTRYEFAAILYRAMTKGAVLSDKILSEFSHELEYFTVDTIAKDKAGNPTIQRVRTVKENKNK